MTVRLQTPPDRTARVHLEMPLLRRAMLPAVLGLLLVTIMPIGAGVADAATGRWTANCSLNVRSHPTTLATRRTRITENTAVASSGMVRGGSYLTTCRGSVSGHTWLAITAIGGRSVKSLFGVSTVYAAAALFRHTSTSATTTSISQGLFYGVDVSQWNGRIDFPRLKHTGRSFVIARATAGRLTTDSMYARNRAAALAHGMAVGAYHYAHPDRTFHDAIREADHFVAVAQIRHGMLIPALDLESGSSLGPTRLTAWVRAWLERVYAKTGVKAMIYTTRSFWADYLGDTTWFSQHGYKVLWIARWHSSRPIVPAQDWNHHGWSLWQYSDCGSVRGIPSQCVDLDVFRGWSLRSLRF
jgi:GH25 family lysozyme M1 (1,4-beta-N-acetylmuramidase)